MESPKKTFAETALDDLQLIDIPVVKDRRGNLAFIQEPETGFAFKRIFYIYDIPSGAKRGGHAHIAQREMLIAISGSFDVRLHDGRNETKISLNRPDKGLLIPPGIWRELENFSANSVCLVLNSGWFSEEDYVRRFRQFKLMKKHT
ncbi:MAG: WxcM-like domain-containing protein [Chlorobi bacterium]|nr:WxcM-like domain-containing protein [Chlorobiota bacterium]